MTRRPVRQLTLAACAAIVMSGVARAQSSEQLLQEVKAAWQARQNAVKSAQISWGQKTLHPKGCWSPEPPLPAKDVLDDGSGSMLVDGERIRLQLRTLLWHQPASDFFPRHRQVAFDGEKFVALDGPSVNPWHQATVKHKSRPHADYRSLDLWPLRVAIRPIGKSPFFGSELIAQYTSARRVVLGNQSLIELAYARSETLGEAKMWVDPARGHGVVRHDEHHRSGGLLYRIDIRQEQRGGQWLPTYWKVQLLREKGQLDKQVEVTLRECVLSPHIPDGVFQIEFPVGTYVDDMSAVSEKDRTGELRYVVRENGERRVIDPSERGLRYEQLMATQPGELVPEQLRPWWKRRWVLPTAIGAGLLMIGIALVVFGNRHRNKSEQSPASPTSDVVQ